MAEAQYYGQQSGPYGQPYGQVYGRSYGPSTYQGTTVVTPRGPTDNGQTIIQDGQGGSCVVPPGASSCFPYR